MKKLLLAIAVVAACGHGQKGGNGSTGGSGSGGGGNGTPAAAPLTEAECTALHGRIVDIGMDHRRQTKPNDPEPTPEAIAAVKADAAKNGMAECLQFARASYDCVMAATDVESLGKCAQE